MSQQVISMEKQLANRRAVRYWLYFVALMIFFMVLVGGATRLTDSGLSITEWKPIHGVIPPLSVSDWQEEFEKYKQIPEYQRVNKGMTLQEFKGIFWWEWGHRFLGRIIGLIFFVPLLFFWVTGRLEKRLKPRLVALFLLGGLQGFIGWWMVTSGLVNRVDVSQYRLAIHLTIASLIFAYAIWLARGLSPHSVPHGPSRLSLWGVLILLAVFAQIFMGGLVAGLDAGLAYNEWPKMDGDWIPDGLDLMQPLWLNWFENALTVQFNHRMGAYIVVLLSFFNVIVAFAGPSQLTHRLRSLILLVLVLVQTLLGIMTLLMTVPMDLALAHQGGAMIVLAFVVAHLRALKGEYPFEGQPIAK